MSTAEATAAVVRHLTGEEPTRRWGWQSIRCISPAHDDSRASARINFEEGAYCCLACGLKAGSPIQLLQRALQLSPGEAARLYQSVTGDAGPLRRRHHSVGFDTTGKPRSYELGQGLAARWLRRRGDGDACA